VEERYVKGEGRTTAIPLSRERTDDWGQNSPSDFDQRSKSDDPSDALVEELVAHGVGRTAAMRYAREKPETCRRCLEYLPYATIKTTKGAWLANAIRDEYGPPPGYEEGRERLVREREAERQALVKQVRQAHEIARREEETARLRAAYRQVEETQGEALAAFNEYVRGERARTERIALHLSAERRTELLAGFEQPERRLELFEAWISSHPILPPEQPGLPHADKSRSPGTPERQGREERGLVHGTSLLESHA
jgi:hypothetical protein